ncbi:integral membrane protein, YkoY family [Rubidibacter lacunae KORDI 51-2]|uniref:Integral membrane protein, YkoY family n=1 Tax=Rubidibacter lacunae KORDI 51-2 TaxID=582515 RepID=U5DJY8_9CHRO|nr:integral membrane protein, YkoY family [Rubidibacter lacunae]ERN42001.1 integral membrane protein, YkoY family [Rubidibacter lacunae KORDI 51-2]
MLDRILNSPLDISAEVPLLLLVLILMEAVLSADNAIALAAIAQGLHSREQQRRALNIGLVVAYTLRVTLILTAAWVVRFWQFELLGAAYLLWLVFDFFASEEDDKHRHHGHQFANVWQAVPAIALADLAFSLDSVTTAIALSDRVWLVLTGGLIGVVALRFLAGLFIRWLDEFENLETAGYITVGFVGLRLLARVIAHDLVPPQWALVVVVASVFAWGFSKPSRQPEEVAIDEEPDRESAPD